MNIVPIFSNLLVRVSEEKKAIGGIDLPDNASPDAPQRGVVTAKGDEASKVSVGQEVIFRKYSPDIIELSGEKHYLLAEQDVIAVITE